jgi:hypothetical protein
VRLDGESSIFGAVQSRDVMESSTEVTAVIPLLFLVVTQISSAGREMDLVEVAGEHNPFILSFFSKGNMGRFNFVHGVNVIVLVVAVVTSAGLTTGLQSRLLVAVSITLWVVTPALEVDEYDQILDDFSDNKEGDDDDEDDKITTRTIRKKTTTAVITRFTSTSPGCSCTESG